MSVPTHPIERRPIRHAVLLGAVALTLLVTAVFYPIVGFAFADIDVGRQLIENPHVRGLSVENLKHIFTTRSTTSYYPVRSLSLAIDYQIWGLDPAGFELTNGLLHLANVLLLYGLLLRLLTGQTAAAAQSGSGKNVVLATLGSSLLAVHPLVVEPVAWVGGREELLMTLGALGCIHCHISASRLADSRTRRTPRWAYRGGTVLCCLVACLSNAVGAVIPALVVAYDLLMAEHSSLSKTLRTSAPLWGIAIATIVIKKLGEYLDPPSEAGAFTVERLLLISNVYWINLQRLVWPTELAVFYAPLSPTGLRDSAVLCGAAAIFCTPVVLWLVRRQRLLLFGVLWFGIALAPASQVMVHHIHRADRFFYLALPGLALAAGAGLKRLLDAAAPRPVKAAGLLAAACIPVLLGGLSAVQVRTWQDAVSIWQNCVRVTPQNARFRVALADRLAERGENRRAIEELETVVRMEPRNGTATAKLAWLLVSSEQELRDSARGLAMAEAAYRRNPALFRSLATIRSELGKHCAEERKYAEAMAYYESALAIDAGNQPALTELAWLLATCSDPNIRDPNRAVENAELAKRLNKEFSASQHGVLAVAYAQTGQREKAAATARRAMALAKEKRDAKSLDELLSRLQAYDIIR